ncbi:MAG: response regulator [Rhodospirillales bacterium]|jgi:DNA-binding response OmpR family regulator
MQQDQKAEDRVKILVVDDDESAVEELLFALCAAGFDAVGAYSAAQGLKSFLRDDRIAVVVSDIRMPGQDGIGFLQKVRRCGDRGAACGLIIMTGSPEVANAIAAIDLRVAKYLPKPFEPDEALAAVAAAVSAYRKAIGTVDTRDLNVSTLRALLDASSSAVISPQMAEDDIDAVGSEARDQQRAETLKLMLYSQKLRSDLLPLDIFGDPAWSILLELALIERSGKRTSVSGLTMTAPTSRTTALRRIQDMVEADLIVRHEDPHDRRRSYVELSSNARGRLNQLLDRISKDQSS